MNSKLSLVPFLLLVLFGKAMASTIVQPPVNLWASYSQSENDVNFGSPLESDSIPVSLDQSIIESLHVGLLLDIQLDSKTVSLQLSKKTSYEYENTDVWYAKNLTHPEMPQSILIKHHNELSGWFATSGGVYRLFREEIIKEYRSSRSESLFESSQNDSLPTFILETATGLTTTYKSAIPIIRSKVTNHKKDKNKVSIKVLFVVTDQFIDEFTDYRTKVLEYVSANNEIYHSSNVEIQLEVAGIIQSDLEPIGFEPLLEQLSRNEFSGNGSESIALDDLQSIWEQRYNLGADAVVVLKHQSTSAQCGMGMQNGDASKFFDYNKAFSVIAAFATVNERPITCSLDTLGQQLGRNMGLSNAVEQGGKGSVFSYGRGFGITDRFSTIMASSDNFGSAEAIPLYSSPQLTCPGDTPCGIANNQENGADAAWALNQVKYQLSYVHNDAVAKKADEALGELPDSLQSCINDSARSLVTNQQVIAIPCTNVLVNDFSGLNLLPNLQHISLGALEPDLKPLNNLQNIRVLDLRASSVPSLRDIAHLRTNLRFLQFSADQLSCQDLQVVRNWGIDELFVWNSGLCNTLSSDSEDFDNDGINNLEDIDDDNDGIDDITDHSPLDASNKDDIDSDGVNDSDDAFPHNPEESADTDRDSLGNNIDPDDDNDGVEDSDDCAPLDNTKAENCDSEAKFVAYDYDGDGKADVGVRRPNNYIQYILNSKNGDIQRIEFGRNSMDISVSGDFDGDRIADIAVRRSSNQFWYIRNSGNSDIQRINFGRRAEDIPVPADYDGDGKTDIAVRRPSNQFWYIQNSSDNSIQRINFGLQSTDIPVPADYDGDGKADIAVRRPSNQFWYIRNSSNGEIQRINFGRRAEDIPVPADYDGDGKADIAVRRPSNSFWYILNSSNGDIQRIRFGLQASDVPIPADYDGDGKADVAFRRASNYTQYILRSSDGVIERITFGRNQNDMPLAAPVNVRMSATDN